MSPWTKPVNGMTKALTMARKTIKGALLRKNLQDPFLRTIKLESQVLNRYVEFKMRLDTGCEGHDLIALEVVTHLQRTNEINFHQEDIIQCLNGEHLGSIGTIALRWKGKGFRKVFETEFHVIDGGTLPWQVILGAETIDKHGILKFAGFGGKAVMPKEKPEDKARRKTREEDNKKKVEENNAKKAAHKKAKEDREQAASSEGYKTRN